MHTYDLNHLFLQKQHVDQNGKPAVRLLWAGRFLKLKHPEYALRAAKYLAQQGISFHLDMVGGGALEESLRKQAADWHLGHCITFHGFQPPQNVRRFMEEANIFLFTSNYLEGWGAVLNEAMNSGLCGRGGEWHRGSAVSCKAWAQWAGLQDGTFI